MLCKEQGITVLGVCIAYDLFVAGGKDLWEFCATLSRAVKNRSKGEASMNKLVLN